jgi:hypothetical protein
MPTQRCGHGTQNLRGCKLTHYPHSTAFGETLIEAHLPKKRFGVQLAQEVVSCCPPKSGLQRQIHFLSQLFGTARFVSYISVESSLSADPAH